MEDLARISAECSFDGQIFAPCVDVVQHGQVIRESADVLRIHSAFGGQDRHFNARAGRQVVDQTGVGNISVELEQCSIADGRIEDVGGVFLTPLQINRL